MTLSTKQRAFIDHYLATWNASEAARRAGYSAKTAGAIGHENLKKPEIAAAVEERIAELKMSADEVLLRLADQARASAEDFMTVAEEPIVNEEGQPVLGADGVPLVRRYAVLDLPKAADRGKLHLVKKLSYTNNGPAIELYDAQAALALLGKHHGLFVERQEHEHKGAVQITVTYE